MNKIKVGIAGYGNLGKGLIAALQNVGDMELVKVFTRRDPESFEEGFMENTAKILDYKEEMDVLILALGSATDIPKLGPEYAAHFNTVDTYDNHGALPAYYETLNKIALAHHKTAMIAMGWDPGLFSLNRMLGESVLPNGKSFTFWGKGVSQGHSDALRRVKGVKHAVQYTIPKQEILENIAAQKPGLKGYETHDRQCFVVAEDGADKDKIKDEIVNMKAYFKPYHTEVNFISEEVFFKDHRKMFHGGHVIRVGETGDGNTSQIDFGLNLDSNPEFTASVALMGARAVYKMSKDKLYGAKTILNTPPFYYAEQSHIELIEKYL